MVCSQILTKSGNKPQLSFKLATLSGPLCNLEWISILDTVTYSSLCVAFLIALVTRCALMTVKWQNTELEWGWSSVSRTRRWLQLKDFSFFRKVNSGDSFSSSVQQTFSSDTHLDRARDLYGSSPANNQHPADLALCQSLQGWLGDVSLLQKHRRNSPLQTAENWTSEGL